MLQVRELDTEGMICPETPLLAALTKRIESHAKQLLWPEYLKWKSYMTTPEQTFVQGSTTLH